MGWKSRKGLPPEMGVPLKHRKMRRTRGFVLFSYYVLFTYAICAILLLPLILWFVFSLPYPSAVYKPIPGASRDQWKRAWRVRMGYYHRLVSPTIRQALVYFHVFVFNMLFFAAAILLFAEVQYALSGVWILGESYVACAFLYALVPSAALFVVGVCLNFFSWFMRYKDPLPVRSLVRLAWRTPEKVYEKEDDSVLNLLCRPQIQEALSMSSLARLDKGLLCGVPTALVALGCYVYDVKSGQENSACLMREAASGESLSVGPIARKLGFYRS